MGSLYLGYPIMVIKTGLGAQHIYNVEYTLVSAHFIISVNSSQYSTLEKSIVSTGAPVITSPVKPLVRDLAECFVKLLKVRFGGMLALVAFGAEAKPPPPAKAYWISTSSSWFSVISFIGIKLRITSLSGRISCDVRALGSLQIYFLFQRFYSWQFSRNIDRHKNLFLKFCFIL